MRSRYHLIILTLLFTSQYLFGGTTGKITGTVTDSRSGDKLPTANVVIDGTRIGASANFDGYYVILNVPPGTYRLSASLLGYKASTVIDVRVEIDQTTEVNFALAEEAVAGEEVLIVATRPVVQKDIAASRTNITAAEVENLPVSSVASAVSLQAGVQEEGEGQFRVRGGELDQTVFMLNGHSLRDARDNTPYTGISITSIEDVQVQSGGFTAEYGNVRSGLVNVVTKEGAGGYSFSFFGRYSPVRQKYFGAGPNDPDSYWIRPFVDDAVAWTGTTNGAWDQYTAKQYASFQGGWIGVSQGTLANNDPADPSTYRDDLTPEAAQRLFLFQHRKQAAITNSDFNADMSFGGPVPFASTLLGNLRFFASYRQSRSMYLIPLSDDAYRDYNGQIKFTSDIAPGMKLNVEGLLSRSTGTNDNNAGNPGLLISPASIADLNDQVSYIDARIFSYDYWAPTRVDRNMVAVKLSHVINQRMFYTASIHRFESQYRTGHAATRDTTRRYLFGNSYYVDEAPYGYPSPFGVTLSGIGGNMNMNLGWSTSRDTSTVSTLNFRFDMTGQLDRYNEVKAGAEFIYTDNDVNYASIDPRLLRNATRSKWHTFPKQGALYLQDKLEFEGMSATIGLRLDYSHAGGGWFALSNLWDPVLGSSSSAEVLDSIRTQSTERKITLSPRLGVSFPITEDSKVFFNYGHFRSLPTPDDLFLIRYSEFDGTVTRLSDPNAPLPRTIQYELGYEQNLLDQFLIRVAGYYKDVTNEERLVQYIGAGSNTTNYNLATSNTYRDIRGAEFTVSRNRGQWVQGFINYTYDVRSSGYFGRNIYYQDPGAQRESERTNIEQTKPVPRPFARANVDLSTPGDFGPDVLGIKPLADWRVNLLGAWSSGFYLTWTGGSSGFENNVQWRDTYNVNMKVSKAFRAGPANVELFVDIINLFNFKFMGNNGFTDRGDYEDYLKSLHLPKDIAGDQVNQTFKYPNFPGDDRPGDYRKDGVPFTPFVAVNGVGGVTNPASTAVYYDTQTGQYMQYANGAWAQVDAGRIQQLVDDKAYIDMPNMPYFAFLNPRDVYFGLRLSLDL